jgi:hypothetical protein
MSYVEHCKKHGQYHGEICGECFEDLKVENTRLKEALQAIAFGVWIEGELQDGQYRGKQQYEIALAALEEK